MSRADFARAWPGQALPIAQIPDLGWDQFARELIDSAAHGCRVAAFFGTDAPGPGSTALVAVLADNASSVLQIGKTTISSDRFPSLTREIPQIQLFEREIAEEYGVVPEGHPWFKPVRFQPALRAGQDAWSRRPEAALRVGEMEYYQVVGDEIHEVAVGPVHAGIIEPGHFRFQCRGEKVLHLEISLGYQHRGIERMLLGGPGKRTIHAMETAAGDTSIGHALAYSQAVEALAGVMPPLRAESLRCIALELERLANHVGDLGALANDVGFLPTSAYCGRLRGDYLNMTALLCGNRFGRGLVRPGGAAFDVDDALKDVMLSRLDAATRDVADAVNLLWDSASVQARFEGTGAVSRSDCLALGMVGPAARACGVEGDVRNDFPTGLYRFSQVPVSTWDTGDVFARAFVRWLEIQRSTTLIREQLLAIPDGPTQSPMRALPGNQAVVTLVEGWRGAICHVALTDDAGRFSRYKIVDPSFLNWSGLALAMRDQPISDFPLCNKSFNLSYCGFDL